jgi:hypothetical protein
MTLFEIKRVFSFLNYKLRRPHRNGHGIHSPFLFSFVTEVVYKKKKTAENLIIAEIPKLRRELIRSSEVLEIDDLGAGSVKLRSNKRRVKDIARFSSSSSKYGMLLYKIVNYFNPTVIVELGTCLGLGTSYLTAGSKVAKVFTVEGSQTLYHKAQENFRRLKLKNIVALQGNFHEVLPNVLHENDRFDIMYIDGNHTKTATLHYFYTSLRYTDDS